MGFAASLSHKASRPESSVSTGVLNLHCPRSTLSSLCAALFGRNDGPPVERRRKRPRARAMMPGSRPGLLVGDLPDAGCNAARTGGETETEAELTGGCQPRETEPQRLRLRVRLRLADARPIVRPTRRARHRANGQGQAGRFSAVHSRARRWSPGHRSFSKISRRHRLVGECGHLLCLTACRVPDMGGRRY